MEGKLNPIARKDDSRSIIAVKTGRPSPSRGVQVMVYMYMAPAYMGQYLGVSFDGKMVYTDQQIDIPASAADETFIKNMSQLLQRLGALATAWRVPSPRSAVSATFPWRIAPSGLRRE